MTNYDKDLVIKTSKHVRDMAERFNDLSRIMSDATQTTDETAKQILKLLRGNTKGLRVLPDGTYVYDESYDWETQRHLAEARKERVERERERKRRRTMAMYKVLLEEDVLVFDPESCRFVAFDLVFAPEARRQSRFIHDGEVWVVSLASDVRTKSLEVIATYWGTDDDLDPARSDAPIWAVLTTLSVPEFLKSHTK